ncbi:unnamed protein product [Leptidea sinapis]|uniref:Uncharacterized protein n=1 Tax=Leptidea sinapis TaxID=189913 RepID=A0A5E4PXX5_9NEOP|nr:unnamed protein product [Leptidea sinapis]
MLEGQTVLMLTLQGPWSERDAQMTETFDRLQDIYGRGKVLGILVVAGSTSGRGWYYHQLRWEDGTTTVLDTPVGEPTVKPTRLYTILVVRFADGDNTRDKL